MRKQSFLFPLDSTWPPSDNGLLEGTCHREIYPNTETIQTHFSSLSARYKYLFRVLNGSTSVFFILFYFVFV